MNCRFDLLHVMIDEPDDIMDYRIASHIVAVHQRQDQAFDVPYTMADIQLYLKYARAHKPELTASVSLTIFTDALTGIPLLKWMSFPWAELVHRCQRCLDRQKADQE